MDQPAPRTTDAGSGTPQRWVSPETLTVYDVPSSVPLPPGPALLIGPQGQRARADLAALATHELTPAQARQGLDALRADGAAMARLLTEGPVTLQFSGSGSPDAESRALAKLLQADSAEEAVAALTALAGTADPAALEGFLGRLEGHLAEAQARLARGEGPPLPSDAPTTAAADHPQHPQALALLALARRAGPGRLEAGPTGGPSAQPPGSRQIGEQGGEQGEGPVNVQIKLAPPKLDFSWDTLSRGLTLGPAVQAESGADQATPSVQSTPSTQPQRPGRPRSEKRP